MRCVEEVVQLRVKLESRTWFLRASVAFNAGLVSGMVLAVIRAASGS